MKDLAIEYDTRKKLKRANKALSHITNKSLKRTNGLKLKLTYLLSTTICFIPTGTSLNQAMSWSNENVFHHSFWQTVEDLKNQNNIIQKP